MHLQSWLKDMFPDFLWMCALINNDLNRGMYVMAETLLTINEALGTLRIDADVWGRLTQFESIPKEARERILDHLEKLNLNERAFPEGLAHALALYPNAPGFWLVERRFADGTTPDPARAEAFLAPVIAESFDGQHLVPMLTKFMFLRGMMKGGKIHFPREMPALELLPRYPNDLDEDERARADTFIRATFLGMVNLHVDGESQARLDWCQEFWRANWSLYACIKPNGSSRADVKEPTREQVHDIMSGLSQTTEELKSRFEEVALHVDPDLYVPDKYEVLTGLAARTVRLVQGALTSPLLWTDEYGAGLMRSVVEAKILIRWLGKKNDPTLYTKYKDYGRGRLKLLKLHLEAYIDAQVEVPAHLEDYLKHLTAEVNADLWEEFQDIDLDSTFSDVSAWKMAADVGLQDDYNLVFSPTSGSAHGDWAALDRYALTRCRNSLHMWHRIPDFDERAAIDPSSMALLLSMAGEVVTEYINAII